MLRVFGSAAARAARGGALAPASSSSSSSSLASSLARRGFASSSSSDDIEEFLDRHLAKPSKNAGDASSSAPPLRQSVATTRRESLALYRDILRFSRFFTWTDQNGVPFRQLIRESARKEYQAARFEKDPQVINKLIISGRDCLEKSLQNVIDKQRQIVEEEQRRNQPPPP